MGPFHTIIMNLDEPTEAKEAALRAKLKVTLEEQ